MTRQEMINRMMDIAVECSGIKTTDPEYLGARRELEACSDFELRALIQGAESGLLFEIAAAQ